MIDHLLLDIRYALRGFSRSPAFTLAAVLSIAIGIGANTAVFSVANAVLLRALPYRDAGRLVILWNRSPGLNITQDWFSPAQYFDIKNGNRSFEQVAIAIGGNFNLTGTREPERVGAVRVSSNLFPMLGAQPVLGRLLVADDDVPGRSGSAILTHAAWIRRYAGDVRAVGKTLLLNGQSYLIAGVLPPGFSLPKEVLPTLEGAVEPDLFLPLPMAPSAAAVRTHEDYNIVGKLRSGASVRSAQAELDTLTARLRREHPDFYPPNGGLTFSVVPLLEQVVGDVRRPLVILLAAVSFVLLIACSNVANLLLSRATGRKHEILVRAALGATASRIVKQALTESLLLATASGAAGVVLAYAGIRWARVLGPASIPRLAAVDIDGRVLAFTMLLSVTAGILFGLAPALRLARSSMHEGLRQGRGTAGAGTLWGRGNHLRRGLVILEAALSVTLAIGAGLLIRSFGNLQSVPAGFDSNSVLTVGVTLNGPKYQNRAAVLNTYRQLWNRLETLPGSVAAGGVSALPLSEAFSWGPITVEGRALAPGEAFINADQRIVAGRYFQAMRIPLLKGRFFNDRDVESSQRVVVVDDNMARQLWPHGDPIGKRIRFGGATDKYPWETVVGVVGRVKQYTLDTDSRIAFYMPHAQQAMRAMSIVVRSATAPLGLVSPVKQAVSIVDPDLPIYDVSTMQHRLSESLARRRFSMWLLAIFAALAIVLSAVGLYGMMTYLVNQGTKEIGIRMALGATQHHVTNMVLRAGFTVALLGATIGIAGAAVLTRFMQNLLFGVNAVDPITFILTPLLSIVIATAASWVPARRAARVDPVVALRSE